MKASGYLDSGTQIHTLPWLSMPRVSRAYSKLKMNRKFVYRWKWMLYCHYYCMGACSFIIQSPAALLAASAGQANGRLEKQNKKANQARSLIE